MKIKNLFFSVQLLTFFAFTISSCSDKKNEAPVITLDEPANGETIVLGDSIHIEGMVTDDESLHELMIKVSNSAGATVFQSVPAVHNLKSYTFHHHVTPFSADVHTLTITAADHEEVSSTKTVTFTVTP